VTNTPRTPATEGEKKPPALFRRAITPLEGVASKSYVGGGAETIGSPERERRKVRAKKWREEFLKGSECNGSTEFRSKDSKDGWGGKWGVRLRGKERKGREINKGEKYIEYNRGLNARKRVVGMMNVNVGNKMENIWETSVSNLWMGIKPRITTG